MDVINMFLHQLIRNDQTFDEFLLPRTIPHGATVAKTALSNSLAPSMGWREKISINIP